MIIMMIINIIIIITVVVIIITFCHKTPVLSAAQICEKLTLIVRGQCSL